MKYIKAQDVLPEEVIELIQKHVDGEFVYIPRKNGKQKSWGENSGTKESLKERNKQIYCDYKSGTAVPELSKIYYLSEQSIRRIVSQEKLISQILYITICEIDILSIPMLWFYYNWYHQQISFHKNEQSKPDGIVCSI